MTPKQDESGEDGVWSLQDHGYYNMKDEAFNKKLRRFHESPDKKEVPVTYVADIGSGNDDTGGANSTGTSFKFERQRLVPAAAIEEAKHNDDFNENLCHAIAFHHNKEMMDMARAKGLLICTSCGKTAERIVQVPTGAWHTDPLMVQDVAAKALCRDPACDAKAKRDFFKMMNGLKDVLEAFQKEQPGLRTCLSCNKIDENLLRCSRCKKAFFCNAECQKRAWKRHKPDCNQQAGAATSN